MQEEIAQLNELLGICRNAEKGYATAAQRVADPGVKTTLERFSKQRSNFAYELAQRIRVEGGDPAEKTGIAAGAHRIWINLKGIISGENAEAIIRECLRGEKESIQYYEKILNATTFSNDTRMLLAHQMNQIKAAHRELEEWVEEKLGK